jgi:hypothetical protein
MLKSEFMDGLEPVLKRYKVLFDTDYWALRPDIPERVLTPHIEPVYTEFKTETPYTKGNLNFLKDHIPNGSPYYEEWAKQQRAYRKTETYRELRRNLDFFNLAEEAGLEHDEHGGYNGVRHNLSVIEFVWRKKDLRKYHATGNYLGLVNEERITRYAGSSRFPYSTRDHRFVVGTNENEIAFCHQVPNSISSLQDAINWIWRGYKIEARQGDVGITSSNLKHVRGKEDEIQIVDSHFVIGEIYTKHGLHVRNGFIYHKKEQHPAIYVGPEWKKIIVGRRSTIGMSSAD